MNQYAALILTLGAAMACAVVMRVCGDWVWIGAAEDAGKPDELDGMREYLYRWQARHLGGAATAIGLIIGSEALAVLSGLSAVTGALAAYAVVSCLLAATESVLLQRLAAVRVRVMARQ